MVCKSILLASLVLFSGSAPGSGAPVVIGGESAGRWQAQPTWSGHLPSNYTVRRSPAGLLFSVSGANSELPWTLRLNDTELDGDSRYLLVRYRATGLSTTPGNYLLHGFDGPPGGRTYVPGGFAQSDGLWHTLAVDMAAMQASEPVFQLAVKVISGASDTATVEIASLRYSDELPPNAAVSPCRAPTLVCHSQQMGDVMWREAPGWVTNPARNSSVLREHGVARFSASGTGLAMRWTGALPQALDLGQTPVVTYRYRLTGWPAQVGYALWLGSDPDGARGPAWVAATPANLIADGRWHTGVAHASSAFVATHVAVGIDCVGPRVGLELGLLSSGNRVPPVPLGTLLANRRAAAADWRGFRPGTAITGGREARGFVGRIGVSGWFSDGNVLAGGIPFAVGSQDSAIRATGYGDGAPIVVRLPQRCSELYLLTAVACPDREPFGLDANSPRPQDRLAVPEKAYVELRYTTGPPDRVLAREVSEGRYGFARGLAVHVVRPAPGRSLASVSLVDRMQTASIGLLAATARVGRATTPVVATALVPPAWRNPKASQSLQVGLSGVGAGIRFSPGPLKIDPGPLFEVEVNGRLLPPTEWSVPASGVTREPGVLVVDHPQTGLRATLKAEPDGRAAVRLNLSLANRSGGPVTATVRFPVLRGVRAGSVGSTWYLAGKRGGIINRDPIDLRLPLGEQHPLQVDGFFGDGASLACVTHDTEGRHHFVHLSRGDRGGDWWPEYPLRDLPPGGRFACTEAELSIQPGGWREILAAYRRWLRTWYTPPARKRWFERTFAFISRNSHYDSQPDAAARGLTWPTVAAARSFLGGCDYLHLYGWGASRTYGDWGDYNHYDETVGGYRLFRESIGATQRRGVSVGLYVDGYLSSAKGADVGNRAREWAITKPDGSPDYVPEYASYNQCPSIEGWRTHLASVYRRLVSELAPRGLYIDEFGATDARWLCSSRSHGHNGYEVPSEGELATLRAIRSATGPNIALYTEYPPFEAARAVLDGSFTYQAIWSADDAPLAPHCIDLPRFVFPRFKQFHITHYVPFRAGNWWVLNFPFFNGEPVNIGEPNFATFDADSRAFVRKAVGLQVRYRDAFASDDVEPLVDTLVPGLFANRFAGPKQTVYTLYNSTPGTQRGALLRVRHEPGASYWDAWSGQKLVPVVRGGYAVLSSEIGPMAVGCLVVAK